MSEMFGALIAWHQYAFARDANLAAMMCGIAADETRHAVLDEWSGGLSCLKASVG